MKKLLCLLLVLLLAGCGASPEPAAIPPAGSVVESNLPSEGSAATEEERFLQTAWWYLQSDEKELFSWENGQLEPDFRTEVRRMVVCPEGETDIRGRALTRVKYVYQELGEGENTMRGTVNLYFDGEEFVGTDYGMENPGYYHPYDKPYWAGDMHYWLFLSSREVSTDGALTLTCVLKNCSETGRTFSAFAPKIMLAEYYQEGRFRTGGIDAAGQEFTLAPGEIFVETHTLDVGNNRELLNTLEPGPCTVLTNVELQEGTVLSDQKPPPQMPLRFTLFHTATFTITESS